MFPLSLVAAVSHHDLPRFLLRAHAGPRVWASDAKPLLHDLLHAEQARVLLAAARTAHAAYYADPLLAEALAISEAGNWLAIIRYRRRDSLDNAGELGIAPACYQAALRTAHHENLTGDVTRGLRAYGRFRDEVVAAVARVVPSPQQLRALAAALADAGKPNRFWARRFERGGEHPATAGFMANLLEKLACELPEPARSRFLRDCGAPDCNIRRMVRAFRARYLQ
jgi:hypothetical protein